MDKALFVLEFPRLSLPFGENKFDPVTRPNPRVPQHSLHLPIEHTMPVTGTTISAIPSGDESTNSLVERVQDFVSEHKKAILIATAAAAVAAGIAYVQYSRISTGKEPESAEGKKKKKSSSKATKKKKTDDGPLLEERKPKVNGAPGRFCLRFDTE